MNIFETIGLAWVIFTSSIASCAIIYSAMQHCRRLMNLATRGGVEERRDVIQAMSVREMIG